MCILTAVDSTGIDASCNIHNAFRIEISFAVLNAGIEVSFYLSVR